MSIDVTTLTEEQLDNLIENHRSKGATTAALYLGAMSERARRRGNGLEFDKSRMIIASAARDGRFVSYKELADASGADWSRVHYAMNSHLWELVRYAHGRGWPMLSAIVVNKPNLADGKMEPDTLKGFVAAGRELGHSVIDAEEFLRKQQKAVFEWGKSAANLDMSGPKE